MLGKDNLLLIEMHIVDESLAKRRDIGQWSAAEEQRTFNFAAMSQRHNRLDCNGTEDGSSDILTRDIFCNEVLDIGLAKHATSGCDGINLRGTESQLIKFVHRTSQDDGHLVDESACASRTLSIHAKIACLSMMKENHLGIFASDVNHGSDIRILGLNTFGGCNDLLNKRKTDSFCYTHADRTCDTKGYFARLTDPGLQFGERLNDALERTGQMTNILAEYDVIVSVQGHHLRGGRTHVDSKSQSLYIHSNMHIFGRQIYINFPKQPNLQTKKNNPIGLLLPK